MGDNLKEIRAAKAAYMREWRRKNPEKDKKNSDAYWARRAEKMRKEQEANQ